jgi:RHS repeat-associated protein
VGSKKSRTKGGPPAVTTSYTYDADGDRVAKSNGTTGMLYWYMSPGIVAESDLSGNLQSEYVFFDGERVARKDFPTLAVSYYFSDHLKTTDIVTDAQGNIKNESDFYPWGGELQFLNNDSNHYKVTAKERDPETGLDYFGARYYSNGLARFITPDWAAKATAVPYANFGNPQSLNLYMYSKNNPATFGDPDGHDPYGDILVAGLEITTHYAAEALSSFGHWLVSGPSMIHGTAMPAPPACGCKVQDNNKNNESKQNSNNSQSSNAQEQPRDAQGKFLPKKGAEAAPGAAAEKEGLDSVGAVKNKNEILNGTKRDGTIPETGQHVEVKSGESINNTEQLRNMGQAAMDATKKPLKVVTTNPNAEVSGPASRNPNLQIEPMKKK